jgi:hypothetical protein
MFASRLPLRIFTLDAPNHNSCSNLKSRFTNFHSVQCGPKAAADVQKEDRQRQLSAKVNIFIKVCD